MIDNVVKILKARITCLEREAKGVCGYPSECDSCEYCYGQGTVGEQKEALRIAVKALENQQKVGGWISVSERLPEEHESVFAKAKGTDKWSVGMFEGSSDDVNVTVEFADGTRATKTSHTLDGVWECEKRFTLWEMKVIAWMPLPDPYKGE